MTNSERAGILLMIATGILVLVAAFALGNFDNLAEEIADSFSREPVASTATAASLITLIAGFYFMFRSD